MQLVPIYTEVCERVGLILSGLSISRNAIANTLLT